MLAIEDDCVFDRVVIKLIFTYKVSISFVDLNGVHYN